MRRYPGIAAILSTTLAVALSGIADETTPANEQKEVQDEVEAPVTEESKPASRRSKEISELKASLYEEDGWFVFEFENTEAKPVTLCVQYDSKRGRFYQFHFDITWPDGTRLTHNADSDFMLTVDGEVLSCWGGRKPVLDPKPGKDDFIELAPGDVLRCKLNPYFVPCPETPKPGEYKLAVRYNNSSSGEEFGYDAVVGVLHTEPLTVTLPRESLPRKTRPKRKEVGGKWWLFDKAEVMEVVRKKDPD